MRVVFVNLHGNEKYLRTMDRIIFRRSCSSKHRYLLDYLIKSDDFEVCVYVNEKGSTVLTQTIDFVMKIMKPFRFVECKYVLKRNSINLKKIKILKNKNDIKKDDIVLLYNCDINEFYDISDLEAFKAVSLLHYVGDLKMSNIVEKANINIMFSEADLQKTSELFRINYGWYKNKIITHAFVYKDRFKNIVPFQKRKNKAVAMGTIIYRNFDNFVEIYGDDCVQPLRKMMYDNQYLMKEYYDSYVSDYNEDTDMKNIKDSDTAFVKLYKKVYNKCFTGRQKKYFSFDMVEKYNEYKMCLIGEEVMGIPGIGFVEGMACGCAYIGLDSPMYTDLGLIPGKHYITYDGTIENLKQVIEYYQADEHQEELEEIAKTGCEYVRENFRGDKVAKKLIDDLIEQQEKWLEEKGDNCCG